MNITWGKSSGILTIHPRTAFSKKKVVMLTALDIVFLVSPEVTFQKGFSGSFIPFILEILSTEVNHSQKYLLGRGFLKHT